VIAEKRKQWVSARGHFKLAVQYAPEVSEYQEAFERTSKRVDAERADELWAQALEVDEAARTKQLKLSKWLEVVSPLFEQSLELAESVERVKSYALRCVELGDHERAEPWLRRSIDEHPFAIDLKWVLLQSLEARGQLEGAHAQCDAILALDPSEPRALAWRKRHAH
jgi:tetratricopeptide (TPR) repeat protein